MSTTTNQDLVDRVEGALEQLRPFFKADGGDMRLLEITSDNVAVIGLVGACCSCSMSDMSLRAGEEAIKKVAPEIVGLQVVKMEEAMV